VPENRDEDGRLINENVAVLACENYELFAVGERSLTSLHPVTSICFYIYILIKIRQPPHTNFLRAYCSFTPIEEFKE
jgi:hypothetical protein